MNQHYLKHHPGKELPHEYRVSEGKSRRLWRTTLHPGRDVAPQCPYQEPPKPPLPWSFNLMNPPSSATDNSVAAATAAALARLLVAATAQQQQHPQ